MKDGRPIHQRDPLFAVLFRYADRITAEYEATTRGVRVVETSNDSYVVKLWQAHADVVNAFIANGRSDMASRKRITSRRAWEHVGMILNQLSADLSVVIEAVDDQAHVDRLRPDALPVVRWSLHCVVVTPWCVSTHGNAGPARPAQHQADVEARTPRAMREWRYVSCWIESLSREGLGFCESKGTLGRC